MYTYRKKMDKEAFQRFMEGFAVGYAAGSVGPAGIDSAQVNYDGEVCAVDVFSGDEKQGDYLEKRGFE